jgi:hypothetical protein
MYAKSFDILDFTGDLQNPKNYFLASEEQLKRNSLTPDKEISQI